ncbi:MAG: hypothetical protein QW815_05545 [Nitrososphaerota archaeon]
MHIPREVEAHWGNHIWPGLWYSGLPVPVVRFETYGHTPDEVREALAIVNTTFHESLNTHKDAFYLADVSRSITNRATGVLLFGSPAPSWAFEDLYTPTQDLYSSLPTHFCPKKGETPFPQPPLNFAVKWPLVADIRASENPYGIGGLVHELLHALGIADHYYTLDCHGRNGTWGPESVMSNPGLVYPTQHDKEDIKAFYTQTLHTKEGTKVWGMWSRRPWWLRLARVVGLPQVHSL